ncbi:TetR/AcrR family transcriptional regulator [Jannaschia sp. W003]|uniref:TetR/AcrR family transcriptional regulator n=1 Tax=Jannaschia sp. W003 TaxID=2867012 RepID=UPI0021A975B2|nr:TetR/AcrR family transcriptional regulator [Jannaschia sp. W003]UWQ21738.1 TetR/AcrR family transcriptional regulator [Jannaschia sp. W003]
MNEAVPVKKGRKFAQVLEGARVVFLADGYEGASVDAIAKAAGVSKATLYSYFPDKRLLFLGVAEAECLAQVEETGALLLHDADPEEALRRAGRRIVDFVLSDTAQRIFRMCVAEADRFPELGREFFRTGPAVFRARMVDYLREAVAAGRLRIDDVALAADQFVELCHATLFPEMVFGVRSEATDAERARVVDGAVATFLARYGAGRA